MRFEPGDRFNDFEVIEHLGSGTYGTVYSCTWAMDQRKYAVKVFEGSIEGARREFTALQGVKHQNVVGCLYAGSITGGGWYLQCELVSGQPLSTWVRVGHRFEPERACDIAFQLLAALEAIHPDVDRILALKVKGALNGLTEDEYGELAELEVSGLVHRDVKPENIILTEEGRAVLVDFGLASQAGSTMKTGSATQEYLPPDFAFLAGDRWRPDLDLYAAGAVVYELLCGQHPYIGSEYGTDPKPPPEDLPKPLAAWLVRACSARQTSRFPSAPQMRASLLGAVSEQGLKPPAEEAPVQDTVESLPVEFGPIPYTEWVVRPATSGSDPELLSLILEIVEVEGPIICGRLYGLVANAVGCSPEAVRSRLNRLVYGAVRVGRLSQVEPLGQGQIDKTVLMPGAGSIEVRELGPRSVWQYPAIEMTEFVRRLVGELDDEGSLLEYGELTAMMVMSMLGVDSESWEARYLEESALEAHAALFGVAER